MTALRVTGPSAASSAFRISEQMISPSGTAGAGAVWNVSPNTQDQGAVSSLTTGFTPEADAVQAARVASRTLVRQMSKSEKEKLYAEHSTLTEKKFVEDSLSAAECRRLKYLEWQIDRVEDADVGDYLDELDVLVSLHEKIASEVEAFAQSALGARRSARR